MIENNFVRLNQENIFFTPFKSGIDNFKKAFSKNAKKWIFDPSISDKKSIPLSAGDRIKHFSAGAGLLIPIINIIVYLALKRFATIRSSNKNLPSDKQQPQVPQNQSKTQSRIAPPNHPANKSTNNPIPQPPQVPQHQSKTQPTAPVALNPTLPKPPEPTPLIPIPAPQNQPPAKAVTSPQTSGPAGVLPYYINKHGEAYFLLGREYSYGKSNGTWADFGGSPDAGETQLQTAARECWEESRGILGDQPTIEKMISSSQFIGNRYKMFFLKVEDTSQITDENFQNRKAPKLNQQEKTELAWVKASDVMEITKAYNENGYPIEINGKSEFLRNPFAGTFIHANKIANQRQILNRLFRQAASFSESKAA